ncbi:hypothetical protein [Kitasatospora sp. NPDC056184]|uniref:hypothetical protein n=1 Tax=Kitasatospora sp. NPDC056184 TaxID=3345738 RepID=UPI0035DD8AE7
MIRRLGRLLGAAGVTLALASGGLGTAATQATAAPLPIEQCTTSSGVVLAVDLGKWGGPLLRSCGTTPTTGYALLNQGGWKTTGTGHDGPAFICRIGYSGFQGGKQFPAPDQEKCVLTPPATAYWSYWHADPGQNEWSYSQLGAMSYQPKPGSVDLWIFGGTNIEGTEGRPTISPDTVRAHNTVPGAGTATTPAQPSPPTDPGNGSTGGSTGGAAAGGGNSSGGNVSTGGTGSTGGSTSSGGGSASGGGTAPKRPTEAPSATSGAAPPRPTTPPAEVPTAVVPVPEPSAPSGESTEPPAPAPSETPAAVETAPTQESPTGTPDPSASVNAAGPLVVDAAPAAEAPHDAGSMVPAVVGGALLVLLGLVTFGVARRRRRAE